MSDTHAAAAPAAETAPPPAAATPAPAAAPAAPAAPTLAQGGEGAQPIPAATAAAATTTAGEAAAPPAAAAPAPERDWRREIAGTDDAYYEQLKRYAGPSNFGEAHKALRAKLSDGETGETKPAPTTLAADATPEQAAEWRKANGIPEKPEDYALALPNGFQPPEQDNELIDLIRGFAHKNNWTAAQFNGMMEFNYQTRAALAQVQQDRDQEYKLTAEDALRQEWGADYRRNLNALGNFREQMPQGMADRLFAGRMADGTLIGNDPQFLKWATQTAIDFNPAATLLPAGINNGGKGVTDEIARIETLMKTEPDKYWKDSQVQAQYRDLLEARIKLQTRAA